VRLPTVTPQRYRHIALVALLALCGIVVTGAAVRLTGSGLGCTDWPTCEDDQLVAPLEYHAMVEFVNRLITGVVSVSVALAVLASLRREPRRRDLTRWSLGLVAGVVAQVLWGGVTVLTHLNPLVVQGHFLLSMLLVWNAVVLHHLAGLPSDPRSGVARAGPRPAPVVVRLATLVPVAALVAVTAGTVVTATGPHGGDQEARRLTAFSISDVARVHGLTALVFLGVVVALVIAVVVRSSTSPSRTVGDSASPEGVIAHSSARGGGTGVLLRWVEVLVALVLVQIGVGYTQYFNDVPPLLVGIHVALATAIWAVAVKVALVTRSPAPPLEQQTTDQPDRALARA